MGEAAQNDLSLRVARFLDSHLVFPLLEFVSTRELYDEADIEAAKLQLIEKTNMVDYAVDIYQQLNKTDEVPESLVARRKEVVDKLHALEQQVKPITDFLSSEENVKLLKSDKTQNMAFLQKEFSIGPEQVDALYHFAKWNYECGSYATAAEYLYHYRTLSTHPERSVEALWGKLAADILLQDWTAAMEDLVKLKELLDLDTFAPVSRQLQQKAWLMHWALFVFFNHENGLNALADLFLSDRYITALQLTSQHLLRYLAVAVVVNKRRRSVLKDLMRVISQEAYEYKDPVTEFLRCLFVDYDFAGAREQLAACESVLSNDYFCAACKDLFMEAARQFLFETYCRCHQAIDMKDLGGQLGLGEEATEKWIVNLVRNARLNAKIDSQAGTVVMQTAAPSSYEQLLDKARALGLRTFALSNTVSGMLRAA